MSLSDVLVFRQKNDVLHPLTAGNGGDMQMKTFTVISKYLALQCNKTGF
jgi:hypothetical protein